MTPAMARKKKMKKPILPEGQGPEMTIEQIEAMELLEKWREIQPVWQPLVDVLRGDAP